MLLAEKKMEEIEGNMKGWEHFQERAKLNATLWDFLRGESILRVAEMSGTPQKKHDETCDNQALLTLFSPYHARPSDAIGSSLEVMKRTWTK